MQNQTKQRNLGKKEEKQKAAASGHSQELRGPPPTPAPRGRGSPPSRLVILSSLQGAVLSWPGCPWHLWGPRRRGTPEPW